MIALLTGILQAKTPEQVVLQTGGVGYRVFVSLNTFCELPALGLEATLHIHTAVRDDAFHLYGFAREEERQSFNKLISISGVGPRLALGILSHIAPPDLWQAVRSRDAQRLTKIPGIGKKLAARLVVELEGKLPQADNLADIVTSPIQADALSALTNLGFPEAAARQALAQAGQQLDDSADLQQILKACLRILGGNK